ncbi:MAG TPA: hypothetical protein VGW33_15365 [Terriglobia bacterium]|nr:hypothetical protein [Terriglobia bacterium]
MTEHPDQLLLLGQVAETWGCRPSDLLGIRDSGFGTRDLTMALQLDLAAAVTLWRWKEEQSRVES